MSYPGGKNGEGTFQRIINQIPPHSLYVEPFAGSAAIARAKRPAAETILIDRDAAAIAALVDVVPVGSGCAFISDGITWLELHVSTLARSAFIYIDPPYLPSTRTKRQIYAHEMTREDHERLLAVLLRLKCMVMVSGYHSALYARALRGWRTDYFRAMTRGGPRVEWLWMNYDVPTALHDYRYLGRDFRQREVISRRIKRWVARLAKMPALEQAAIMDAMAGRMERRGRGESVDHRQTKRWRIRRDPTAARHVTD